MEWLGGSTVLSASLGLSKPDLVPGPTETVGPTFQGPVCTAREIHFP